MVQWVIAQGASYYVGGIVAKNGRPTKYRAEFNEQARKLCLLGATDKELADFFNICEATLNTWKHQHEGFLESLRAGKDLADANVVESLYNRANGYSHKEERVFNNQGEIITRETVKHYPPDPTSMIFWLKNRQPDKWREKNEISHSLSDDFESLVSDASDES